MTSTLPNRAKNNAYYFKETKSLTNINKNRKSREITIEINKEQ